MRAPLLPASHPLIQADKDIAQALFGYQRGRPTLSRRSARILAQATGMSVGSALDVVHAAMVVGLILRLSR
jgi:hypothetical protein